MPNVFGASLNLLQKLGVETIDAIEEQTVEIDNKQAFDLLKLSLISKTPLTDFILKKNQSVDNLNLRNNLEFLIGELPSDEDRQMSVEIMLRKSNEQGLGILKASLISTSALTNGLNQFIKTAKSVQIPDVSSATQVLEVQRGPLVEELPLPPNIQPPEPSINIAKKLSLLGAEANAGFSIQETKNTVLIPALQRSTRKRKGSSHD
ncbi:hypothetical protein TSUD_162680 [Trifolium subterraneum]|uniref:Uncharacterized protein n=1 Tax=Trifolium subterraneum TaxID=3900 RepID=A0A2Z6MP99_TRISU|nr:hypothetical protein TSUD_162680 [Trifolium subterraneum]